VKSSFEPNFNVIQDVESYSEPSINVIQDVISFFEPSFNAIQGLFNTINNVKDEISSALMALETIFDAVVKVIDDFGIIREIFEPFKFVLEKRITMDIPGPFCTVEVLKLESIPYPCGVTYCRKCVRWIGCYSWACGVKYCRASYPVLLPV
jgi:hypothetical protein